MFALAVFVASALLAQAEDTTAFSATVCDCPTAATDSIDTFDKCLSDKYTANTCDTKADVTATVTSTDVQKDAITVARPASKYAVLSQIDLTPSKTAATCTTVVVTDGKTPVDVTASAGSTLTLAIDAADYAKWSGDLTLKCKDSKVIFAEDGNTVKATFKYTQDAPSKTTIAPNTNTTTAPEGTGFNMGVASLLGAAAIYTAL